MNIKKILIAVSIVLIFALFMAGGYYFAQRKNMPAPEVQVAPIQASSSIPGAVAEVTDYCLGSQCWQENAKSLFQELFGSQFSSIAPDGTSFYINPVVNDVYFDDNWNETCAALKQKVAELISGKAAARDKILAIANWVSKSRPYGPIPSGTIQDICGLFGAHSGISTDAAALTVAMLKYAGITARVVYPSATNSNSPYAYASVLLDGKWLAVDTVFGEGQRNIFEPTAFLGSMTYRAFEKPREIIISSDNKFSRDFAYYLADGIFIRNNVINSSQNTAFGTVTYIKPRYSVYDLGVINNVALTAKDVQCNYYSCNKVPGVDTNIKLPEEYTMIKAQKIIQVSDGKIVQETDKESVSAADLRKEYYVSAGFPPGSYRFEYRSSSGKLVAYYDFELKPSDNLVLKPDMLLKGDGADDTQFKGFIDYLRIVGE